MKNILTIKFLMLFGMIVLATACDDDPTVQRSKVLQVYGGDAVYVGDTQEYTIPSYALHDTYSWAVSGAGASVSSGSGEYLYVAFNQPGNYAVKVTKPDGSEGTLNIEAISKTLSLDDDMVVTETGKIDTVGFPLIIDNEVVAGTTTISYTIGGTAVPGVDYELISPNPLVLTADSEEDDYYIYVRLFPDIEQETTTKYIEATITEVNTTIQSEVILADDADLLTQTIEIEDDLREVSIQDADEVIEISEPELIEVTLVLSEASTESVTVQYAVTGTGVNDVTAPGPGSVTFKPEETSKIVTLQFPPAAFGAGQTVTLEIIAVNSADGEVVSTGDVKTVIVKTN